jgi:MFS family permease
MEAGQGPGIRMALFSTGVVVGPVLGTVFGGWRTEDHTWRYVFYINGPLGIIGVLGMMMFLQMWSAAPRRTGGFARSIVHLSLLVCSTVCRL